MAVLVVAAALGLCSLLGASVAISSTLSITPQGEDKGYYRRHDLSVWNETLDRCPEQTAEDTSIGVITWPSTEIEHLAEVECPFGPSADRWVSVKPDFNSQHGRASAKRMCSLYCDGPEWESPDYSACKTQAVTLTPEEAVEAAETLTQSTSDPSKIDADVFNKVSDLLEGIFPHAIANKSVASLMFQTVSNLLDADYDLLSETDPAGSRSRRLYEMLEQYGRDVDLSNWANGGHSFSFGNLDLLVTVPTIPFASSERTFEFVPEFGVVPSSSSSANEQRVVRMRIPEEALQQAAEGASNQAIRVSLIAMRSGHLLRPPGLGRSGNIRQPVITASFCPLQKADSTGGEIPIRDLQSPVIIDLPYAYAGATHVCAYFDPATNSWRQDSMDTVYQKSAPGVRCQSTHLTAFTMLLDPFPRQGLGELRGPMDVITNVGCWLSLVGLILTIITYTAFRLGRNRWGRVLVNLCVALAILNITCFLAALKGTLPLWMCAGVAIVLHAAMLSAFCWMLVEALLLYQLLITVFEPSETHFLLKRAIYAWGFPWIIVGATSVYDFRYYGDTNANYCMPTSWQWGLNVIVLIMPCVGMVIANIVIFIQVACVLLRQRSGVNKEPNGSVTWAQIRGVLGVAFLLGITWVVSPVMAFQPWMQLFSTLANSMQGTVIFVTRVYRVPEARRCWQRVLRALCPALGRSRPALGFHLRAAPQSTASYSLDKQGSIWARLKFGQSTTVATSPDNGKRPWMLWKGSGSGSRSRSSFSTSGGPAEWTRGSSMSYDVHI